MADSQKALAAALATIKHQIHLMSQALLAKNKLMDALKHASNFLNEMRTLELSPKQYYELYIVVYDGLEVLATHLRLLHPRHHLSDLYELVQYAGNLIPRLYLMITVGTVYMSIDDLPKREIMKDMLEMCRGVQHPVRGLFLRYYLMQRTKGLISLPKPAQDTQDTQDVPDTQGTLEIQQEPSSGPADPQENHDSSLGEASTAPTDEQKPTEVKTVEDAPSKDALPEDTPSEDASPASDSSTPAGVPLTDTIDFIITNFVEMNKLWVRLQHQGHLSQRLLRTLERQQLQILVGTNLVRLSQLEDVLVGMYRAQILPAIMEQIVQCRDVLAQEYLVDVIIQIFPDDWHLATMNSFLLYTLQLNPRVSFPKLWVAMVDRLIDFASNRADEAERLALLSLSDKHTSLETTEPAPDTSLFAEFFQHYRLLITDVRPDIPPLDQCRLLAAMARLSVVLYPEEYANIDTLLAQALESVKVDADAAASVEAHAKGGEPAENTPAPKPTFEQQQHAAGEWLGLLLALIVNYRSAISVLKLTRFNELLLIQPNRVQRKVIGEILDGLLESANAAPADGLTRITNVDNIVGICEYFRILISSDMGSTRDVNGVDYTAKALGHAHLRSGAPGTPDAAGANGEELADVAAVYEKIAKILHLFEDPQDPLHTVAIYTAIMHKFNGAGDSEFMARQLRRQRALVDSVIKLKVYPTLVQRLLGLLRRFRPVAANTKHVLEVFKLVGELVLLLLTVLSDLSAGTGALAGNRFPELCLKLYLNAAYCANQMARKYKVACVVAEGQEPDLAIVATMSQLGNLLFDFFVQLFLVYEESVSDSKAQFQCLVHIIDLLSRTVVVEELQRTNYENLIIKTTLYCSKLLRKPDQCRAVYLVSHLWWQSSAEELEGEEGDTQPNTPAHDVVEMHEGKRVLECLQRLLRVADLVFSTTTAFQQLNLVLLELFVEILNQCLYYFIHGNEFVNVKYVNGLVELIQSNLRTLEADLEAEQLSGNASDGERSAFLAAKAYFARTLEYIEGQKEIDERFQMVNTKV